MLIMRFSHGLMLDALVYHYRGIVLGYFYIWTFWGGRHKKTTFECLNFFGHTFHHILLYSSRAFIWYITHGMLFSWSSVYIVISHDDMALLDDMEWEHIFFYGHTFCCRMFPISPFSVWYMACGMIWITTIDNLEFDDVASDYIVW